MVSKIAWVTLTNGRKNYMEESRLSWYLNLQGDIYKEIIVDVSYDDEYRYWLKKTYPSAEIISIPKDEKKPNSWEEGIKSAYEFFFNIVHNTECDFVFHLEDDFILLRPLFLNDLIKILNYDLNISQVYLSRQPWTKEEADYGSVLNYYRNLGFNLLGVTIDNLSWVEHRALFTFNPSLYRSSISNLSLSLNNNPELSMTQSVFSNELAKSASFGTEDDLNFVEHIGRNRLW